METDQSSLLLEPHTISVLFVDDEPEFLSTLQEFFSPHMRVETADGPASAREILHDHEVDVIVSDQRMQGSLGVDFLESTREVYPETGRILITAYGDMNTIVQAVNRGGVSFFLTKPVDLHQLLAAIRQVANNVMLRRQNQELVEQLTHSNLYLESKVMEKTQALQAAHDFLIQLQQTRERMVRLAVHDLKTPLGNIELAMNELLVSQLSEEQAELAELAKQSADIMRTMVDDMLAVAVISQPTFKLEKSDVELYEYLDAVLAIFRQTALKKKIAIVDHLSPDLPIVSADAQQLRHVFFNLLSNAIKFTPSGGTVSVEATVSDNQVVVTVSDTGQGMTSEDIASAFQEFKRLSARPTGGESSTGLGLFIVKKIVDMHGGTIRIDSEGKGKGTTFTVGLPLDDRQPTVVHRPWYSVEN